MNNHDGALDFEASISTTNFNAGLSAMERRVLGFTDTAQRETAKLDQSFSRLGQLAVGAFAFTSLAQLPQQILKARGEVQQLEIALGVLLKSKSKADALLSQTVEFAAKTPFSFKDAANGAKQLLAYGFAAKDIIPTLSRLGDVSAGLGLPLERLTYLYGTTKTQGRLFAQDLNQFVGSGIPLISELAKQFGVAEDKVRGLVEEGKVGFDSVKKAIEGMTSGSGIFAGTLEAQSKSINALKEQLSSAYDAALNEIGKSNEDLISGIILTTTEAVKNYQSFADILGVVVSAYGAAKAATLVLSIAQRVANLEQIRNTAVTEAQALAQAQAASASATLTLSQQRLAIASAQASQAQAAGATLAARAQAVLNGTILANPYVLVTTAVVALVSALYLYRKEVQEIKSAEELMAESAKSASDKFGTQQAEITALVKTIKNQNIAESERLKAYEKLQSVAPEITQGLDFQRAKTDDLTKSVDRYLVSLRERIKLEAGKDSLVAVYKQQAEAAANREKAEERLLELARKAREQQNKPRSVNPDGSGNGVAASLGISAAKKDLEELNVIESKAKAEAEKAESAYGKLAQANTLASLKAEKAKQEAIIVTADVRSLTYKKAEDSLISLNKQIKEASKSEEETNQVRLISIGEINAKIKEQNDLLDQQTTRSGANKVQAEIKRLEAQKRKLTGELTADEKKQAKQAAKDAARSGPFGSIDYYESVSRKASEILEKLDPKESGKIAQQSKVRFEADQQVEELRKRYAIKSFDEEIEDKKSKYSLYTKWIEAYGKQSADTQFSELVKSGQSYVDYLNTQIANLENERDNAGLSDKQAQNLSSLVDQRNEATGKKTAIQVFQEDLEKARTSAGTLADYLVILKQKQDDLSASGDTSPTGFAKQQQVAEEIVKTQAELQSRLQQFLTSYASSGEQQLAIQKDFAEKRAALDLRYNDKKGTDYKQALKVIDDAEKQALQDYQQRKLEETDAYKETTKVILAEGEKRAKKEISLQRAVVEEAKRLFGVNSEAYKAALAKLDQITAQSGGTATQKVLGKYATIVNGFGQALSSLGGEAGAAGSALMDLANTIVFVSDSFTKSKSKAELYSSAIQGVITLFSAITDAAAKRKQAENDYYASVIRQQQEYNLLLNQQIALRSKDKNLFIDDYAGQLLDNFEAQRKAQSKLDESLKKLNEGRAKGGQKNQLDNATALKLIGTGAGTGAAIGALVSGPLAPVGAAVGAVVGAAVGALTSLFGGATKKADEFGALLERYPDLLQQSADGTRRINLDLAQTLIDTGQLDDKTKALVESTVEWQKQVDATKEAINSIVKTLAGQLGDNLRDSLVNAFKEGTDAAKAFSGVLSDVIENFVTKLLYTQIFSSYFDKLKEDITKSLDTQSGGDGSIIDDMQRFYETTGPAVELFNRSLQDLKDQSKAAGFDILQSSKTGSSSNSLQGAIQSQITENTASILAGSINAIRITQADTNNMIRQQLFVLSGIEKNTGKTADNSEFLKSIDRRLEQIANDPLRGVGGVPR